MKVIYIPKGFDEAPSLKGFAKISENETGGLMEELGAISSDFIVEETTIGLENNKKALLVTFNGLPDITMPSKTISIGLPALFNLSTRFKSFYDNDGMKLMDRDGATLLCIDYICKHHGKVNTLEMVIDDMIALANLSKKLPVKQDHNFVDKPYTYYLQAFLIDNCTYFVFGIKSNGKISKIEKFQIFDL